jgi:hypothetical protein
MQPFMEKACQARLLEEVACSTKGRKAKCHIGCFGEANANLGVAFRSFPAQAPCRSKSENSLSQSGRENQNSRFLNDLPA